MPLGEPTERHPASPPMPDEWSAGRLEARHRVFTLTLDGSTVAAYTSLGEFAGYLGLQARRGMVEFRHVSVTRLPASVRQFEAGFARINEPGIEPPRALEPVQPFYPREPFDARDEGLVWMEVVVLPDVL